MKTRGMKARKPTKAEERQVVIDEALERLRVHVAAGMGVRVEDLPGMEGSVVALAVEAILLRRRLKRAREMVLKILQTGRVLTSVDELLEVLERG